MNEVIAKLLNHRSVRSFEDRKLTPEQIQLIVQAAQAASTSSFIQAYSIIGITDPVKNAALAKLSGPQSYVENNGHFFIFCADLHRLEIAAEMEATDISEPLETTEKFLVATIDATLAAQNAAIAAESMDLGICYIGGIRNHLDEVIEMLDIPAKVIPLFGMAVGYPKGESEKKPRLPFENIYHENGYQNHKETFITQLKTYNETISSYYRKRTNAVRKDMWTSQMVGMIMKKSRMYMKDFIERQGMNKR